MTGEGCHDLTQVGCLLEAAEGSGRPLLADSAYDYHLAYRLRKVAEGFFGAIAVRYLSRIRLLHVQECSILLMAVHTT